MVGGGGGANFLNIAFAPSVVVRSEREAYTRVSRKVDSRTTRGNVEHRLNESRCIASGRSLRGSGDHARRRRNVYTPSLTWCCLGDTHEATDVDWVEQYAARRSVIVVTKTVHAMMSRSRVPPTGQNTFVSVRETGTFPDQQLLLPKYRW